jgi:hypothetical protein
VAGGVDYDAPCPACGKPIGDHTLRGYSEELEAAGFSHSTPHRDFEGGPLNVPNIDGDLAGEIKIAAATMDTILGKLPVLRFMFYGAGPEPMSRVALKPVNLVLDADGMRAVAELVSSAALRAVEAAKGT